MRAAIYARVSSAAQREKHTIENQLRALPGFVAQQGWTLAGTYVDDGRSAKAGKLEARDGFARLVRDADAKLFDILVVVDIDRLTRTDDLEERARILGPFQRNNIQIVTPTGGQLDLRTMLGELYVTFQALVAAEENRKRAERVKAGKSRAIAEGRKPAGPTPYGLAYSRIAGAWSIDEVAAAVVREIYRRVIAGESCMAIADDLDARAVRPPRWRWTRHTVWGLVRSRNALGEWTADKRKRLTVTIPAILDEATWQAAQRALLEHGKRGLRRTRHAYLLEGLAVCGLCGSPMAIRSAANKSSTNGNPSPAAYVCRARKLARRGEHRCRAEITPIAEVDERVWAKVEQTIHSPNLAARVAELAAARAAERKDWAADAAGYRTHLERLVQKEAGLLARWQRGTIGDQALDIALAALRRERTGVEAQLDHAAAAARRSDSEPQEDPGAWVAALRELAASTAPEARQRVVRAIVEAGDAVFDGRRVRLTLRVEAGSRDAGAGELSPSLAVASGCSSTPREPSVDALRIRVVA